MFFRVPKQRPNLEAILKGIPEKARVEMRTIVGNRPFGYVAKKHRAFRLVAGPEGDVRAEAAHPTTDLSNAQRAQWREHPDGASTH